MDGSTSYSTVAAAHRKLMAAEIAGDEEMAEAACELFRAACREATIDARTTRRAVRRARMAHFFTRMLPV